MPDQALPVCLMPLTEGGGVNDPNLLLELGTGKENSLFGTVRF